MLQLFVRQFLYFFFPCMIRFYKYPAVYRCVLISPSPRSGWWAVLHSEMTSSQQQLMTALEFFGTIFTLHWLRAHRIIISQLCFMSLNTGHASALLREISKGFICGTGISQCLWERAPRHQMWLTQGNYRHRFLGGSFPKRYRWILGRV